MGSWTRTVQTPGAAATVTLQGASATTWSATPETGASVHPITVRRQYLRDVVHLRVVDQCQRGLLGSSTW
jgi:hypothetical protein